MYVNEELTRKSELVAMIVELVQKRFSQDVAVLVAYGSFVTGNYGELSDIDLYFVPKTDHAYGLCRQFILGDIGYDLWPVTWDRLDRFSTLAEPMASLLMDGVIVWAGTETDAAKFTDLKSSLVRNLQDSTLCGNAGKRGIEASKVALYELAGDDHRIDMVKAIDVVENLLFSLAVMNGKCVRKGIKEIRTEVSDWAVVPAGFVEHYARIIQSGERSVVEPALRSMIDEIQTLWETKFAPKSPPRPEDLAGFYEEFKSTYNKLLVACGASDYAKAVYAGYMIDRETGALLDGFAYPDRFPGVVDVVLTRDFEEIRECCLAHERQLVALLHRYNTPIKRFDNLEELRLHLLGST